jgi:4-coumarate--CoA ligase
VPNNVSLWSWLFSDQHLAPSGQGSRTTGGFRDAINGQFLSFHDLKQNAIFASTALAFSLGLRPGETVAAVGLNSIWYPAALFAAVRIGVIVSPLPAPKSSQEFTYFIKKAQIKAVFVDSESYDVVLQACREHSISAQHVIVVDVAHPKATSLKQLIDDGRSRGINGQVDEYELPTTTLNNNACAFLNFSSGTTGLPKAASNPTDFMQSFTDTILGKNLTPKCHVSAGSGQGIRSGAAFEGASRSSSVLSQ